MYIFYIACRWEIHIPAPPPLQIPSLQALSLLRCSPILFLPLSPGSASGCPALGSGRLSFQRAEF